MGGSESGPPHQFSKTPACHLSHEFGALDYMSGLGNRHVETFEGFRPWGTGSGTQNLRHTAVGSFTPTGKTGSGDSVVGDGGKLQVRDDSRMRWGRYNTANTPPLPPGVADGNWLDSNDNRGMKGTIKGVWAASTPSPST